MEAKKLRSLFESGVLENASVAPYPLEKDAWMLLVRLINGEEKAVTKVRTDSPKIYKSYEAVIADLRRIGFNKAEINF